MNLFNQDFRTVAACSINSGIRSRSWSCSWREILESTGKFLWGEIVAGVKYCQHYRTLFLELNLMFFRPVFERGSFYCWTSQRHTNLIKSSHKAYVLQSRSFCFLRTHAGFQIAVLKFEANFENSRSKDNSTLESCGKNNNIEFKEFLSRYGIFLFVYIYTVYVL